MASEPTDSVSVKIFSSRDAAEVAASLLEANGIACWIFADDCGGFYPNLAMAEGVRLVVSAADLEAACELLEVPRPSQRAVERSAPPKSSPLLYPIAMILIGAALGASLVLSYRVATSPRPLAAPLRQTHDAYSPDGRIHDRWVYREGQLVEHLEDRNSDGSWDYWLNYEDGWVSRVEYDNNFDGRPDETLYYKNGRLVSFEKDTDFNGIPDEFGTCKDNLVQELDIRPNGSKFTITREIYSNGVPTEIQRGGDANGHFKETVKYDAFYNPISTDQTATTYPLLPVH